MEPRADDGEEEATSQTTGRTGRITLGEPIIAAEGEPGVVGPHTWGFYQFPKMWRGRDGVFYLAMNVGADSSAGRHEPPRFFRSQNEGRNWVRIEYRDVDMSPDILDLPNGRQVAFGGKRHVYSFGLREEAPGKKPSALELGLKPVAGPFVIPYLVTEYCCYRYADVPENLRRFPVAWRACEGAAWQHGAGAIEMPDLLLRAMVRDGWPNEQGEFVWEKRDQRLSIPMPQESDALEVLPDGTILWALASQHPEVRDRFCTRVACLASADAGRTWRLRGSIANDTTRATWGYGHGEQSLARMPDGDLFCVMRTMCSNDPKDSHYLAAAWSTDDGRTWSAPEPIALFSVTPHLIALRNDIVALVYGRPGVHVRASADSGRTWTEAVPVVGPPESEFSAQAREAWWATRHDYSCANTTVVLTGGDRFLVAYSDFQHAGRDGQPCKAIKVREVVVDAGPVSNGSAQN